MVQPWYCLFTQAHSHHAQYIHKSKLQEKVACGNKIFEIVGPSIKLPMITIHFSFLLFSWTLSAASDGSAVHTPTHTAHTHTVTHSHIHVHEHKEGWWLRLRRSLPVAEKGRRFIEFQISHRVVLRPSCWSSSSVENFSTLLHGRCRI